MVKTFVSIKTIILISVCTRIMRIERAWKSWLRFLFLMNFNGFWWSHFTFKLSLCNSLWFCFLTLCKFALFSHEHLCSARGLTLLNFGGAFVGVIIRDIRSENVLVDFAKQKVLLHDFHLADFDEHLPKDTSKAKEQELAQLKGLLSIDVAKRFLAARIRKWRRSQVDTWGLTKTRFGAAFISKSYIFLSTVYHHGYQLLHKKVTSMAIFWGDFEILNLSFKNCWSSTIISCCYSTKISPKIVIWENSINYASQIHRRWGFWGAGWPLIANEFEFKPYGSSSIS